MCTSSNKYTIKGRNLDLKLNIDTIDSMVDTVYKGDVNINNHRCPHCGESYYIELYSECTAVYYPPIYKDGVNINPDKNKSTTHYKCMNCRKEFSF